MRFLKLCTIRVTGVGIVHGEVFIEWSPDGRLAPTHEDDLMKILGGNPREKLIGGDGTRIDGSKFALYCM